MRIYFVWGVVDDGDNLFLKVDATLVEFEKIAQFLGNKMSPEFFQVFVNG